MNFIARLWHRRIRRLDLEILWPAVLNQTSDLDQARAVFLMHMQQDRAWRHLGEAQKNHVLSRLK